MCIGAIASASRARREQEEKEAAKRLSDQTALAAHLIVHISGGNKSAIRRTLEEARRLGHRVTIDGYSEQTDRWKGW